MARHFSAIFDDLIANLAELKAALSPLALFGGTVVAEAGKPAKAKRRGKGAAPKARRRITPRRREALQQQGRYMTTLRGLKPAQRAQVKNARAEKGLPAALALAKKLTG